MNIKTISAFLILVFVSMACQALAPNGPEPIRVSGGNDLYTVHFEDTDIPEPVAFVGHIEEMGLTTDEPFDGLLTNDLAPNWVLNATWKPGEDLRMTWSYNGKDLYFVDLKVDGTSCFNNEKFTSIQNKEGWWTIITQPCEPDEIPEGFVNLGSTTTYPYLLELYSDQVLNGATLTVGNIEMDESGLFAWHWKPDGSVEPIPVGILEPLDLSIYDDTSFVWIYITEDGILASEVPSWETP